VAKSVKVQQVDISAAVERVIDSNVGKKLELLDIGYTALITEVYDEDKLEGTVLYIPGISYKTLLGK
jgi:hypothetical protein